MKLAETVVGAVRRAGGDTLFGVPGGGPNLAMIGAAQAAGMRFVLTHTETAGAITAATYGLLRGAPAMAIATRGPGAASAVNGAAQATLDRYPLLLVTDCVGRRERERVAHQRLDQTALLAPAAKWSGPIGDDALAPEAAAAAVALAGAAPRGAVHLDFDPSATSDVPPLPPAAGTVAASPEALDAAAALLRSARRTVAVVGFDAVDDAAGVRLALERLGCPVLTTYQAIGVLPEGHPACRAVHRQRRHRASAARHGRPAAGRRARHGGTHPAARPDRPTIAVGAQPPASTFVAVDVAPRCVPRGGATGAGPAR
ncbi:MAG: thiamine pyrophosphate-binding protein [Acidimicrobiales bacterium]